MRFNSWAFIIFLVIVVSLYYLLRRNHKHQNFILLVASYIFYGWWDARFLFLIALSTYVDYCSSYAISYGKEIRRVSWKAAAFLVAGAFLFLGIGWNEWRMSLLAGRLELPMLYPLSDSGWLLLAGFLGVVVLTVFFRFVGSLPEKTRRRAAVVASVTANLAILGFFKYFNFFSESFATLWSGIFGSEIDALTLRIILPVGISFYTFQTMSYTIDVYRGELQAARSLRALAVYVAFFPQLVAGPIERGKNLLPQFTRPRTVSADEIRTGLWLILWGFYKKIVIADNMAQIVNATFGPFDQLVAGSGVAPDGLTVLVAIWAFAFQIYGDFSGYTDIARGTARIMGFHIMANFNIPYVSRSPSEFWTRWHISLSSWLRDYLYIPLGGNRSSEYKTYRNLLLVMLLGGLWHGAAWTFVVWGVYHGVILVIYRLFFKSIDRTPASEVPVWKLLVQWFVMWNLTCVGWLIFRSRNMTTIGTFFRAVFTRWHPTADTWHDLIRLISLVAFLLLFQGIQLAKRNMEPIGTLKPFLRWNILLFVGLSIVFLHPRVAQEFIYFAF